MSLKKYIEKRRFEETPEPAPNEVPGKRSSKTQPTLQFCVQRHHASHLHYDFRLEVDGALKSWAVPKGPTLDPNEKRLAMMVEDHPLEYGSFEGVIPQGNYGGGSVMLWDRGTYELLGEASAEEQLARGDFKFRLTGEKLTGEFAIIRMKPRSPKSKGNEWLLIKKRDASAVVGWDVEDHASSVVTGRTQEEIAKNLDPVPARVSKKKAPNAKAKAADHKTENVKKVNIDFPRGAKLSPMPKIVAPMLATLGKGSPPDESAKKNPAWLFEVKWDGVRAICFVDAGKVQLVSRKGTAIDKQYPELSILPHQIQATEAILDAEIAVLDPQGRPSFELLQRRINVTEASAVARLARSHPVVLYAFDLMYLDGHDLRGVPLIERKNLLQQILIPDERIRYSGHFTGNGSAILDAVEQQGLEGIVSKRADSHYESRRTGDWVKWKVSTSAEFVICGFTEGERLKTGGLQGTHAKSEATFGALVLGVYKGSGKGAKLHWAGNVGTGFDEQMIRTVHAKLLPLATPRSPLVPDKGLPKKVTWTKPELVCTVKFSNWTEDEKLRAPVFLGLRPDIDPSECTSSKIEQEKVEQEKVEHEKVEQGKVAHEAKADVDERSSRKGSAKQGSGAKAPLLDANLLDSGLKEASLTIDGNRLKFTHLDKVFYPKDGYVKRDLLNYYNAVAPLLIPHLKGRPLSLKRYPNGIEAPFFFQKQVAESFPAWLHTAEADNITWVIGEDRATLLYLVNLGCIDHNPWMSRVGSLENPDYVLIDLDPHECGYEKIVEAALWVRGHLDHIELKSYPKTTGGDGMHIFIPIESRYTYQQVRSFAEALATMGANERPDLFTTPRTVSRREKGKVYFDWQQISEGKTISAPYVVRAYAGAPVAAPLKWAEVTPRLRPEQFHLGNALERFKRVGDLFQEVLTHPQRLEAAVEKLSART